MSSVNKVILVGHLGADPELRFTQSNTAVTTLSLATSDSWRDKSGQQQERTEWHRVVVWGKQAETCAEFLSKGRLVYTEGRLQTRDWMDKEGRKQYTTEVVADRVVFLGGGGERRGSAGGASFGTRDNYEPRDNYGEGQRSAPSYDDPREGGPSEDDIPF